MVRLDYVENSRQNVVTILERDGFWQGEQVHHLANAQEINIFVSVSYLRDSRSNRIGTVGVNRDIMERMRSEKLLLLAQKSESISLLAGSIAHDFNNLLTGVLSQTSLALRRLPKEHVARNHIEKAVKASQTCSRFNSTIVRIHGARFFCSRNS